jgi:hypothetical protein
MRTSGRWNLPRPIAAGGPQPPDNPHFTNKTAISVSARAAPHFSAHRLRYPLFVTLRPQTLP